MGLENKLLFVEVGWWVEKCEIVFSKNLFYESRHYLSMAKQLKRFDMKFMYIIFWNIDSSVTHVIHKRKSTKKNSDEKKILNTHTGLIQMKVKYFKEADQQSENFASK